ncbi:MAG: adenylate/guanylate cyclase domain-containing protein [Alphaproteobacteria bacterium]|nr:adenylate/guanylate cyclase domain-containing protein [Alphaproteobacteria bacterium]
MVEGAPERRLTVIVAIDVAGYSRLMGNDEEGTLAALNAHRDTMMPMMADHGGRLVSQAGDGLLLEFSSVVQAVKCAMEMQAAMAARNAHIPDEKKMAFRMGINLGDVLVAGDDIFGDGVNVAARIEALAEPGGICISRTVRDNVRDRLDIALDDMGDVAVKNIARPVRVFRVLADGQKVSAPAKRPSALKASLATAALVLAVAAAGGAWWWQTSPYPASHANTTPTFSGKPSIAVLPFNNMSGDPGQDHFADGMTEDLITDLSKVSGLFVVARNSSFA